MNIGELFEKYYMKENGLWQKRLDEIEEKGFDDASPIARLVYFCEVGQVDQHASEDIKMISAALAVGYDMETELARITAQLDAAISDLQDAVDYVYKVCGESNETLAAITTAHWRAVIADVKKKSV